MVEHDHDHCVQSSICKGMIEFSVEEFDWSTLSPDLNPIKHCEDEPEWRSELSPKSNISVWLHKQAEIPTNTLQDPIESLPRRVEALTAAKGTSSILMDYRYPIGGLNAFLHIV